MTAQILSSELSTLIHESKRKNTELRNVRASTNSKPSTIDTLLTFPCRSQRNLFKTSRLYQPLPNPNLRQVSSTLSLLLISSTDGERDLNRRPQFISPFLIACRTQNAKFAGSAVACLQRLAVSRALPRERLREVLDAFRECGSLGHSSTYKLPLLTYSLLGLEIQLKILQALPSLLQNYSNELRGELLSSVLQVCSSLQNTKNPVVSNTAAATLQQLVISVFDKIVVEDGIVF